MVDILYVGEVEMDSVHEVIRSVSEFGKKNKLEGIVNLNCGIYETLDNQWEDLCLPEGIIPKVILTVYEHFNEFQLQSLDTVLSVYNLQRITYQDNQVQ
jgi:hypothetical protein